MTPERGKSVFILWHLRESDDDSAKLIGVFSSMENLERTRKDVELLPGFSDEPDGFLVDEYGLDEAQWTDGFVTISP